MKPPPTEAGLSLAVPTLADVRAAHARIAPHLARTPLHRYSALDEYLGCEAYVKHENYQPVGAFKVRGGVNLACTLTDAERACGMVTASTGNHGQSIAFGARLVGTKAYIVVPEGANAGKVAAIRGLGAQVVFHGMKFDEAMAHAEQLGHEQGLRFVHSANEPRLVEGVATATLEVLEAAPQIDTIIVPVGLGSGACGACITAKALSPSIRVIGVQAAAAPAVYESWRSGAIETRPNTTFAEGLATGRAAEFTLAILRKHLDEFHLVDEQEIKHGMAAWIEHAHTLAESASGAVLALAYRLRARLRGRRVALMLSGGNTSVEHLRRALAQ
jgi:threonine dehydratase